MTPNDTFAVHFTYLLGTSVDVFPHVRAFLHGSWTAEGHYSEIWSRAPMKRGLASDNSVCFSATVHLDQAALGREFNWGVSFTASGQQEQWAVPTEIKNRSSRQRFRSFRLNGPNQQEQYYLSHCTRLGANKCLRRDGSIGIRFAAWAPNAQVVEVVMGTIWDRKDPMRTPAHASLPIHDIAGGYIADNGLGIDPSLGPYSMKMVQDGVWETDPDDPLLKDFAAFDHKPYMFRVTKNDGSIAFRTDMYSRCQIGSGSHDPKGGLFTGLLSELDGTVSCSVVVDPDRVTQYFREEMPYMPAGNGPVRVWPELHFVNTSTFWSDEFTSQKVPTRIEDLIIYELHVGALGFGSPKPGTLEDAIRLLDYLVALGVNALELLPLSEFGGGAENWGYATSHHFAIEFGGGGRDQYKFLIKECHRRGIAVIMDVVYNHYSHNAERAESKYDSNWPDFDMYYWYEGTPFNYPYPDGGYVDNMSTAYAPRYHEEMVRKLFISSAVALLQEFHIDGFRVDQTTSIHSYNKLHADGREVSDANIYGAKLLREWGRTLRMIKPGVILMAEDHSEWHEVSLPLTEGGMGFDGRWYSDFYHHLSGDTDKGQNFAKLLYTASQSPEIPLAMDYFAGALRATRDSRVVYNESHDEAGNSRGPFRDPEWNIADKDKKYTSHRTIRCAVNDALLIGETRLYAEARCRFAYGMTVLSAGTPMFLFGEEVGAERRFKYNAVLDNKEDLVQLKNGSGAFLFRFYSEINRLRLSYSALRSRYLDVLYVHNHNRIIAFRRGDPHQEFMIIGSLNHHAFHQGYSWSSLELPDGVWQEVFNSDASVYGGQNVGNSSGKIYTANNHMNCVIPANGFIVLLRV